MKPINFTGATHHLGAPANWDPATDGECSVLSVQAVQDPNLRFVSVWMPDDADRALIAAGKPIALSVLGGQPVVSVYVCEATEIPMPGSREVN